MSLKIRMSRGGTKKRPYYKIVLADARSPRDGKFLERLGSYNPMLPHDHAERIQLNEERIKHWLGFGAQPSDRVARFLASKGWIAEPKRYDQPKQSQPKAKAQERLKQQAAAAAAPAPAAEAAAPAQA